MSEEEAGRRYRANLQGEVDSSALYRAMAEAEPDPRLAQVYRRLAAIEDSHAEFWRRHLERIGRKAPKRRPGRRTRMLAWLARRFGPAFVLPAIRTLEQADIALYDHQQEAVSGGLPAAERSHARVLRALTEPGSGLRGEMLGRLEGRHRGMGGNALRAAVLGANDGLVSNLSLVMGVAGAGLSTAAILITGIAGLVAGAGSMAMGEWLSVTSARELSQRQIATEAAEIEAIPEEEEAELALIYQAKGLSEEEARRLARRLIADKETALDTLAREELGIDPVALGGSAVTAAALSFLLFAVGAAVPVAPFLFLEPGPAIAACLILSALAMFAMGAGITILTGRSIIRSGLRQVAIGAAAAALTFATGRLLGVGLGG